MPVFTITSDFNSQAHCMASLKNFCLQNQWNKGLTIIDITHNISPFNLLEAAYVCKSSILNFPKNTIHLILVDIFDYRAKNLLLAYYNQQFFVAPDNGLLPLIFEESANYFDVALINNNENHLTRIFRTIVSLSHKIEAENYAKPNEQNSTNYIKLNSIQPIIGNDFVEVQVIGIDSFENVVLNITETQFEQIRNNRKFTIQLFKNEEIKEISSSYADVEEGEKLAFFNSAGYLEIAINKGNAAGLLGFSNPNQNKSLTITNDLLFYKTIKIFFS